MGNKHIYKFCMEQFILQIRNRMTVWLNIVRSCNSRNYAQKWSPNSIIIILWFLIAIVEASEALPQNLVLYHTHLFKLQTLLCILISFIHLISLHIVIGQIFICLAHFTFIWTGLILSHIFCECSCSMIKLTQLIIQPGRRLCVQFQTVKLAEQGWNEGGVPCIEYHV